MKLKLRFQGKLRPNGSISNTTLGVFWGEYKYALIIFLVALIVLLSNVISYAQGVKVGQEVPDVRMEVIHYPQRSVKISDFRGKLLILDFWATWCAPCVAMIPKMDSLQREFGGRLQFLPVSNQPRQVVTVFLEKLRKLRPFDLPDVLEDTLLNRMFLHTYLPHYVWIGQDGKVLAITGYKEVNAAHIREVLSGKAVVLPLKSDHLLRADDGHLPGDEGDTSGRIAIYHKLVPGYLEDLPSKWVNWPEGKDGKRIFCTNLTMPDLFNIALGEGEVSYPRNRRVYEVKDTAAFILDISGEDAIRWMKLGHHSTSYEVRVPPGMEKLAFQLMQQDLKKYFTGYDVRIEKRQMKCLALVRTTTQDLLRSKGGKSVSEFDGISARLVNFPLGRLVAQLSTVYLFMSPYPVIDKTGYKDWVDLEINANMHDVKAVNEQLHKYGLQFKLVDEPLDMMVIRDRQ